jgi:hypothetical protein
VKRAKSLDAFVAEQSLLQEERRAAAAKAEREHHHKVRQALSKRLTEIERELGQLAELDAARKALPPTRLPRKLRAGDRRPAVACAVASDWHVEERVDPATVNGLNEYNPKIAKERAARFFEGLAWLVREQRQTFDINEVYLFAIGDFITGYIHEELKEGNFMSPTEASLFWLELFEAGIRQLVAETSAVLKLAFRFGNHGRTTAKTQIGRAAKNSFEWMAYHVLRKYLRDLIDAGAVHCHIDEGHHTLVDVYDYRIHLHHGDSVRSNGGIGGIDVPLNRAVAQWRNKYKSHLSVVGHFHRLQMGERLVTNGSLVGYGAYSDWLPSADPEPAQQAFFVVDRGRGKTKNAPIWVTPRG